MAKITIEFDTVEKTLSVMQDGSPIEDVQGISFYCCGMEDDEYSMQIQSGSYDDTSSIRMTHTMYASKCAKNKIKEKIQEYLSASRK